MSNQRKVRAELKQGLHQFLMSLYRAYQESMTHEEAIQELSSVVNKELEYFTKQQPEKENHSPDLSSLIKSIEKQSRTTKDATLQYKLYEEVEALTTAQEILNKYKVANS